MKCSKCDTPHQQPQEDINDALTGASELFKQSLKKHSETSFKQPISEALAHFSLSDLANMAETLVDLEYFRKRVSLSSETVGGPIDVAVISKGDGLVWIKRKLSL